MKRYELVACPLIGIRRIRQRHKRQEDASERRQH